MDNVQKKLEEFISSEKLVKALIEVSKSEPLVQGLLESSDEKMFINKNVQLYVLF